MVVGLSVSERCLFNMASDFHLCLSRAGGSVQAESIASCPKLTRATSVPPKILIMTLNSNVCDSDLISELYLREGCWIVASLHLACQRGKYSNGSVNNKGTLRRTSEAIEALIDREIAETSKCIPIIYASCQGSGYKTSLGDQKTCNKRLDAPAASSRAR